MTISTTTIKNSYSGDGSQTVFAYTFKILADADIQVIIRAANGTETVKTLTTDYTVSGAGTASGGNVTFGTAPTATETVVLRRETTQTQTVDLVENDPFTAETVEGAFDRSILIAQELQEEVDRSIKLSRTNSMTSTEFTVDAATRANKILAFDSSGEIAVTQELGTFTGNWAGSTAYYVRDIIKDTSNNNIYICNTAHTSSGAQPISTNTDSAKWDLLVDAASATSSATAAATSATAAASSATAAASSATAAAASETAAAASETAAAASETAAAASESAAATSESNAATSETNAASSATAAASSATSAAGSATTATTQASAASTSATNAATSATAAASSASAASTSATNAATSETNAATSATAAQAAVDSIENFYLGAESSDPTVDDNGDPLAAGDWYFNTTSNKTRIYSGSAWQDAIVDTSGVVTKTSSTGSAVLPVGTTAQRDGSPSAGYLRWNSDDTSAEVYDGSAWAAVGGGNTTSEGLYEHAHTISANYSITSGNNAMSAGPITVDTGVSVTVPTGSTWTIV